MCSFFSNDPAILFKDNFQSIKFTDKVLIFPLLNPFVNKEIIYVQCINILNS